MFQAEAQKHKENLTFPKHVQTNIKKIYVFDEHVSFSVYCHVFLIEMPRFHSIVMLFRQSRPSLDPGAYLVPGPGLGPGQGLGPGRPPGPGWAWTGEKA